MNIMKPLLDVTHLSISYGSLTAVNDLSFSMNADSTLAMVGVSARGAAARAPSCAPSGVSPSAADRGREISPWMDSLCSHSRQGSGAPSAAQPLP